MLAPQTPTPVGICQTCVFIRPGVCYIQTERTYAILCYAPAAESLFTDEILALAKSWEHWLLFTGLGLEKILSLWPAWSEALDEHPHMMTTKDVRRTRHGHNF
jgi:hypothetical protein